MNLLALEMLLKVPDVQELPCGHIFFNKISSFFFTNQGA